MTGLLKAMLVLLPTILLAGCDTRETGAPDIAGVNGVQIAYRVFGEADGAPVLFIQGVGGEMPVEPDGFLRPLVDRGHRIVVFDNRDSGASTRFDDAGAPDLEALSAGAAELPYTLGDMVDDTLGLLDVLEMEKAHLVGGSAGGMIAQLLAADHPERVCTLTLLSTSSNRPGLPAGEPPGGAGGQLPDNLMRQGLAAASAGDLSTRNAGVTAPAVVVHGTEDEVFPLAHGRELAQEIPTARLVVIDGMGHVPGPAHAHRIAEAIGSVIDRADGC